MIGQSGSETGRVWRILDRVATISVIAAAAVFLRSEFAHPRVAARPGTPPGRALQILPAGVSTGPSGTVIRTGTPAMAIVEFSDFQCPFCGRFARNTYPRLRKEYIAKGTVEYVFRSLPLTTIHPLAWKAAVIAECAARDGKYAEMRDWLFSRQTSLTVPALDEAGIDLHLESERFTTCLTTEGEAAVKSDVDAAVRLGIESTPTFLIGRVGADGAISVRARINGAQPYATFQDALQQVARMSE